MNFEISSRFCSKSRLVLAPRNCEIINVVSSWLKKKKKKANQDAHMEIEVEIIVSGSLSCTSQFLQKQATLYFVICASCLFHSILLASYQFSNSAQNLQSDLSLTSRRPRSPSHSQIRVFVSRILLLNLQSQCLFISNKEVKYKIMLLILRWVIVKGLGSVLSPLSMEHRETTGSIKGQDSSLMLWNPMLFL